MSVVLDNNRLREFIDNWSGFLIGLKDDLALGILRSILKRFPLQGPNWEPLHPFTMNQKGSTAILVDTGQLRDMITVHEQDLGSIKAERRIGVFIYQGYHNEYRRMTNFPQTQASHLLLASLAEIQEFGKIIQVTQRMRAFLHYAGLHLRPTTTHIVIPERSFIRSGFDLEEPEIVPKTITAINVYILKHSIDIL